MAAISGQYGKVLSGGSQTTECQGFEWSRSVVEHAYASCATGGFKKRVAGTKDHSGTLNGLFDVSEPIYEVFDEGDAVTLHLYISTTAYYIVPAMITELSIEVDIDDGSIVPWNASFGGNGAWSSSGL